MAISILTSALELRFNPINKAIFSVQQQLRFKAAITLIQTGNNYDFGQQLAIIQPRKSL
jgi:hypothetical protein